MEKQPVLLLCGCQKYKEYLTAAIRRMKHPFFRIVGVMGDASGEAIWNTQEQIVTLPVSDKYEDLPSKIHAAVTWIHSQWPNTVGIWKTDDDIVYQSMDHVASAVSQNFTVPFWGLVVDMCREGVIHQWRIENRFINKSLRPNHQKAIYCFGHGYWLGAEAIPHIVAAESEYKNSYLEDVCTGYVLNQKKIIPKRAEIPYKELPRGPELLNHK